MAGFTAFSDEMRKIASTGTFLVGYNQHPRNAPPSHTKSYGYDKRRGAVHAGLYGAVGAAGGGGYSYASSAEKAVGAGKRFGRLAAKVRPRTVGIIGGLAGAAAVGGIGSLMGIRKKNRPNPKHDAWSEKNRHVLQKGGVYSKQMTHLIGNYGDKAFGQNDPKQLLSTVQKAYADMKQKDPKGAAAMSGEYSKMVRTLSSKMDPRYKAVGVEFGG